MVKRNIEDYWRYRVDRKMWDTGCLPNLAEFIESVKGYDGLITLKGDDGAVLAQGNCRRGNKAQGVPYGMWSFWHDNGHLAKQYNLPERGMGLDIDPRGIINEWYADGAMMLKGSYGRIMGCMVGRWKGRDEDGEISLREGKRFASGVIGAVFFKDVDSYVFIDGGPYGHNPIDYREDGYRRYRILLPEGKKAYSEGYYRNSLRQGWWKLWIYDGRIASLTYYKDGLPDGLCFVINPWLLGYINSSFREFTKKAQCVPNMVYFKEGVMTTKGAYEESIP